MSQSIYQPYTYLIGWSKLNYWYYGCQFSKNCNPSNLWKSYFTSSKIVKEFCKFHGEPDIIQIRFIFKTKTQTLKCEEKILNKVVSLPNWLNLKNFGTQTFDASKYIWIHKENKEKYILPENLSKYESVNWQRGRSSISRKKMKIPHSPEHTQKMVTTRKTQGYGGYKLTPNIHLGASNPNYGKKHSSQTRFKMKNAWTPERRVAQAERTRQLNSQRSCIL